MAKISPSSLAPVDLEGWMTKQGGSIKTWKKRYFILKGNTIYYFKSQKDQDQTGNIVLEKTSTCAPEPGKNKKGKFFFSIGTTSRTYLVWADKEDQMKEWVEKIKEAIQKLNGGGGNAGSSNNNNNVVNNKKEEEEKKEEKNEEEKEEEKETVDDDEEDADAKPDKKPDDNVVDNGDAGDDKELTIHKRIEKAKLGIPFLQDEDSKVLEFWHIWSESIPTHNEIQAGMSIKYNISTSANMQKLTWRASGPQSVFIQKMVDFFWNVGAPESEIDRLNDVGALMNPMTIGSWIDMSAKGGMDGGWYFPVEIPLKMAIEASDPGEASKKVVEWSEKHKVEKCYSVGRDMGAAPPRQTEIRVVLPGETLQQQLTIGLDAFEVFDFPPLPENAINILNDDESTKPGLCLSVITSSEGFVRLGLLTPQPSKTVVDKLCDIAGANANKLHDFSEALLSKTPLYAEYQFLKEGFGYGVYKEGFDIVFHYEIGAETMPS